MNRQVECKIDCSRNLENCLQERLFFLDQLTSDHISGVSDQNTTSLLVTVLMPCLNEAKTLASCIQQARNGCKFALKSRRWDPAGYEILVADNGSSDGSQEIAKKEGARVIEVPQRGYGASLRAGIRSAKGIFILMGDSDSSYDFCELTRFLDKLEAGYDLVVGNRFKGEIKPGAMPWHHRFIGNPVLSLLGKTLFRGPCNDWHCGLRAFRRGKMNNLGLETCGMEFSSEMIIRSVQNRLSITEIPVNLYPDGRGRKPHLRSFRDGLRHVRCILRCFFSKGECPD